MSQPEPGKDKKESPTLVQFRPCYTIQSYLRFAKIKHVVRNRAYPSTSSGGELPFLLCGNISVPKYEVLDFLQKKYVNLDANLSPAEIAQSSAFKSLVYNELGMCVDWCRWGNDEDYEVTRKLMVSIMPFPLNHIWTWFERRRILFWLKAYRRIGDVESAKRIAMNSYKALSDQLGEKQWMFSFGPSSLDCVVFGHLVDLFESYTPFGSTFVDAFPNLIAYYKRIKEDIFDRSTDLCYNENNNVFPGLKFNFNAKPPQTQAIENEMEQNPEAKSQMTQKELFGNESTRNFVVLSIGSAIVYLAFSNLVKFSK